MDRMKSEFISVVSHELRTPFAAIRGSLGLMATAMASSLPDKALQLVQIGYRNCERLIVLVDDILDMEKLAANRMVFEPRIGDLVTQVRLSLETNTPYAQKFGVNFELHASDEVINVFLDQNRFAQVLTNLLSNAAKFSPPSGCVEITIRKTSDRGRVEVRDHGSGILTNSSRAFSAGFPGQFFGHARERWNRPRTSYHPRTRRADGRVDRFQVCGRARRDFSGLSSLSHAKPGTCQPPIVPASSYATMIRRQRRLCAARWNATNVAHRRSLQPGDSAQPARK